MRSQDYDEAYFTSDSKPNDYGPDLPYDWEHRAGQMKATLEDLQHLCLPFRSLLDVGCGTGLLVRAASEAGYTTSGIDISEWAIANCDPNVQDMVSVGDAQNITHQNRSWDLVCCMDTLEHVGDVADNVVGELCRVAKHEVAIRLPVANPLEWHAGVSQEHLARLSGDDTHNMVVPAAYWEWCFTRRGWLVSCRMNSVNLCMLPRTTYMVFRRPELQYKGRDVDWDKEEQK